MEQTDGPRTNTLNRKLMAALIVSVLVIIALAVAGGVALSGVLWFQEETEGYRQTIAALEKRVADAEKRMQEAEAAAAADKNAAAGLQKQVDELKKELETANEALADAKQQLASANGQLAGSAGAVAATYPPGTKLIALTFDDGPGATTARLLDELKKRGVKATFFVVGTNAAKHPDLLKRMAAEGHVIGNHSYSHQNLTKGAAASMQEQITKCADIVKAAVGFTPTLLRPPGGNYDARLFAYAKEQGLSLVNWAVDTLDWKSRNKDAVLATAFQKGTYGIRDGSIVLMHDVYGSTVDAAIVMMDRLRDEGYTMVTVPELLRVRAGGVKPGVLYYSDTKNKEAA